MTLQKALGAVAQAHRPPGQLALFSRAENTSDVPEERRTVNGERRTAIGEGRTANGGRQRSICLARPKSPAPLPKRLRAGQHGRNDTGDTSANVRYSAGKN